MEWIIGPVPIGTDLGKEVVSIYSTNVTTGGVFYTDSNGRQMMKRTCWNESSLQQEKKPVSACYYPVVSRICLNSNNSSTGVCVLTDRAQGGTSYREGEIELMMHRRLLTDDGFGLEETLNEEAFGVGLVVKGKHRIVFGNLRQEVEDLSFRERVSSAARRWQLEPWLSMTAADKINRRKWQNVRNKRYSALRVHGLPRHIHVLTLEPWKGGAVLLRLENTLEKTTRGRLRNEKADGPEDFVNKPSHITVQLQDIFVHLKIKTVRETTLAANQWLDDARQMDWSTRYVYQGADDEILAEDNVDYRDDSKTAKDRQDDEKDYKEPANYSEEDEENRRKKLTNHKKKYRSKSKLNDDKYDKVYRRRRSVNVTESDLENVINGSFNDKINPHIDVTNNSVEDLIHKEEIFFFTNKINSITTSRAMDTTSNVTILPDVSIPPYYSKRRNLQDKLYTTKKPLRKNFQRSSKKSIPKFTDLYKPSEEIASLEEDFSMNMKKRSSKRRKINKNAQKERRKDLELPLDGPDDGITKSMYEMYYRARSSPRVLKPAAQSVQPARDQQPVQPVQPAETKRRKGRRRLKMRRFKYFQNTDESGEGGRSHETKQDSFRIDYEDTFVPDREDREDSEEGGRRLKMSKPSQKISPDSPFDIPRPPPPAARGGYDDDSAEPDERDGMSKLEAYRQRLRREREELTADDQYTEPLYAELEGIRRKRGAAAEEATDDPTTEAPGSPEEPEYVITLRPTQIRTFVIFFESNFRRTGN